LEHSKCFSARTRKPTDPAGWCAERPTIAGMTGDFSKHELSQAGAADVYEPVAELRSAFELTVLDEAPAAP
jgi:hypothetical protein